MARTRRIGILTGGGDVPGLNSVIKGVVYRSTELGYDVLGIRRGWEGLTHMQPGPGPRPGLRPAAGSDQHQDDRPDRRDVAAHLADQPAQDRRPQPAGLAGPGRRRPVRQRARTAIDLTPLVLDHIEALGIDHLVAIGGDDTLSFARVLVDAGIPIDGHPQDDGQRRPGHRVLHRLLDGDHPGQGADQPAADHPRVRTSGSASSGSSAEIVASPPCSRPMSPRVAASSPRRRSTWTRWPSCSRPTGTTTPAGMRS